MPAGRAGRLWQPSPSLLRAVCHRRGQVFGHRVHLPRPPLVDSRVMTRETGTATRILSVSQHPPLIWVVLRPSRAQQRPRPRLLMPGQPSSRMGISLREVKCISVCSHVWIREAGLHISGNKLICLKLFQGLCQSFGNL